MTAEHLQPLFPYHMVWLATNACNARCIHCSSNAAKPLPNELTSAEVKDMFDQFTNAGVFDVAVSGGEPLTRRDIFEVIGYATARGLRVGVGSNGSTITKENASRLRDVGVDRIQVSVDGLQVTHDRARRWSGLFQRAVGAIEAALASGIRVHVCFTAHRLNWMEMEQVVEAAIGWGVHRFNLSRLVPVGRGDSTIDLTPEEWHNLAVRFERIRVTRAGSIEFSTHLAQLALIDSQFARGSGFIGCQAGIGQGCVNAVGDVMPCVMLPIVAGNLRRLDFETIWRSAPPLTALRDRANLRGLCGSCLLRDSCGGCRAVAYGYSGDPFETDPRCWIVSDVNDERRVS